MVSAARLCVPSTSVVGARCDRLPTVDTRSAQELLAPLATQQTDLGGGRRLIETYTLEGQLGLLWQGPSDAEDVVLCAAGGMGGYLGPADGLYTRLGETLAGADTAVVCVDYRRPSHLESSLLDLAATADRAVQQGARRFVVLGHSFGGAVAIQAGCALGPYCAGVATFATQSAGCEQAGQLAAPLLLFHGAQDRILGPENSVIVRSLAGQGEVRVFDGADHLLTEVADELRDLMAAWIPDRFAEHRAD